MRAVWEPFKADSQHPKTQSINERGIGMLTTSQYFEAKRLWAKGYSFKAIVQRTGAPEGPLKYRIQSNRHDFPRKHREHGTIQEGMIQEVAARRAAGETVTAIARDVGINRATLYNKLREVEK